MEARPEQASSALRDAWLKKKGLSLVPLGLDEEEREFWWGLRRFLRLQLERVVEESCRERSFSSCSSSCSGDASSPSAASSSASPVRRTEKRRRSPDSETKGACVESRGKMAKTAPAAVSSGDARRCGENVKRQAAAGENGHTGNPGCEEEERAREGKETEATRDGAPDGAGESGTNAFDDKDCDEAEQIGERGDRGAEQRRERYRGEKEEQRDSGREDDGETGPKSLVESGPPSSAYQIEGSDLTGERRVSCFTQRGTSALELSFCLAFSRRAPPVYGHPATGVLLLLQSALRTRCSSDCSLTSRQKRNGEREDHGSAKGEQEKRSGNEVHNVLETLKRVFNPVAHEAPTKRETVGCPGRTGGEKDRKGERDGSEGEEHLTLHMLVLDHQIRTLSAEWIADWIVLYWLSLFQAVFSYLSVRGVYVQKLAKRALGQPLRAFFAATTHSRRRAVQESNDDKRGSP
ncbi:hypothetical protein TGGT1_253410 [Toxoplasma gondii GT1]|uniref:Transmembrane protein n=3 Tax=Toxoplasma gondii TaxID=5811 RepID=S7UMJ6_TOXGG|nr:hypothetical protein TGGT1_253410 [Toxoplasma gondii GT1]KAF4645386.1 hypothetical protein TGRH88_004900 [Toxoplasma gondii]KFG52943.1 putative transmembrane protein [Toxoplasma gondii FOU]